MSKATKLVSSVVLLVVLSPAWADDLTGVDQLICAASSAVECWDDGDCATGTPAELNVPQFIEVDLQNKRLTTTKASGLNRATEILNLQRQDDQIVIQGYQNGRAFSFVIAQKTGLVSVAVAAEGRSIGVFGACTPVPAR